MKRDHSNSNLWWLYFVRGIFALLLGAASLFMPGIAFTSLVLIFGTLMIADGIFSIMYLTGAKTTIKTPPWLLFIGIAGIVAGILILMNPVISVVALVCCFALWSFFAGIMNTIKAVSFRREKRSKVWYVISGILCILIALLLLANPLEGAITLGMILGIYALAVGISLMSMGIKLRRRSATKRQGSLLSGSSIGREIFRT